jgi:hypothetical protein
VASSSSPNPTQITLAQAPRPCWSGYGHSVAHRWGTFGSGFEHPCVGLDDLGDLRQLERPHDHGGTGIQGPGGEIVARRIGRRQEDEPLLEAYVSRTQMGGEKFAVEILQQQICYDYIE